jgi:hypothetical protein
MTREISTAGNRFEDLGANNVIPNWEAIESANTPRFRSSFLLKRLAPSIV